MSRSIISQFLLLTLALIGSMILLSACLVPDDIKVEHDLSEDTTKLLDDWRIEVGQQPERWNEVTQERMTQLEQMIITAEKTAGEQVTKSAKEILDKFAEVHREAVELYITGAERIIAQTGVEFRCNADFVGLRFKDTFVWTLHGISRTNAIAKLLIGTDGFEKPTIAPVVCMVMPSDVAIGETTLVKYYGYDFLRSDGQFEAEVRYGDGTFVESFTDGIASTSNYLLQVQVAGLKNLSIDAERSPKLVLKWNDVSVPTEGGQSEIPIQLPMILTVPDQTTTFIGTWSNPEGYLSTAVSFGLARLVIDKVNDDTVTLSSCRCSSTTCSLEKAVSLSPAEVIANVEGDVLVAESPFYLGEGHTWTFKVIRSGNDVLVTVTERIGGNEIREVFKMKQPLNPLQVPQVAFIQCGPSVFADPSE